MASRRAPRYWPTQATGVSLSPNLRAPGLHGLDARAAARAAEARLGQRVGAQAVVAEAVPAGARRVRHQHVARAADRARLRRLGRRGCPSEPDLLRQDRPCAANGSIVIWSSKAMIRTASKVPDALRTRRTPLQCPNVHRAAPGKGCTVSSQTLRYQGCARNAQRRDRRSWTWQDAP